MSTSPAPTYPPSAFLANPHHAADLEAQVPSAAPPPYKRTETSPPGGAPPPTYREVTLGPVVRMNDAQNTVLLQNRKAVHQIRKKRFMKFAVLLFAAFVVFVAASTLGAKFANQKKHREGRR